jgi:hypothetical protein
VKTQAARRSNKATRPALKESLAAFARGAAAAFGTPSFGKALLVALCTAGFSAASWRARAVVVDSPLQQIDRRELAEITLPSFLSDAARTDLAQLPLPEKVSAFHPGLVPTLAFELQRIPWVDSVDSLAVDFTGERKEEKLLPRVRFALKVARPIALLSERGRDVLVARSRRRIPLDRVVPGARSLPRITGLPDDADRERQLDDALAAIEALGKNALGPRLGLIALELKGAEATLVLASGVRVEWGRIGHVPGLSIEERVAQLELLLQKGPPLDQIERASVRWDDPVYVLRPVVASPAR